MNVSDFQRYGRHLILPSMGIRGQKKLLASSALIVGLGGLGSSASLYLAASGIGTLGLADGDCVELSNLHRQIIHGESSLGVGKVQSARASIAELNSAVTCVLFESFLDADSALDACSRFDVLVDCTDNVAGRQLLSDCAVILNKPLVSGAALKTDGQVTVYHRASIGGDSDNGDDDEESAAAPCYRCLHDGRPNAAAAVSCDDGGVLGVVPGLVGCHLALEVVKIVAGIGDTLAGRLLVIDALRARFDTVLLPPKRADCAACGREPTIRAPLSASNYANNAAACSSSSSSSAAQESVPTISALEFARRFEQGGESMLLVDVREPVQFEICALKGAINVPLRTLERDVDAAPLEQLGGGDDDDDATLVVVCRRGIDSERATRLLVESKAIDRSRIVHIDGGIAAYHHTVDHQFPLY
jgi:adenylyltransferase and sulfurtransferase